MAESLPTSLTSLLSADKEPQPKKTILQKLHDLQSSTDVSIPRSGEPEDVSPEYLRLKTEGNAFHSKSEFDEAVATYEKAMAYAKNEEQRAALNHNLGANYEKMGEMEKALDAYNTALTRRPDYTKVLKRRCKLFIWMKQYNKAMDDLAELSYLKIKATAEPSSVTDDPTGSLFFELLIDYTNAETKKIIAERTSLDPPTYIIEAFLRPFYCDPVSRLWKGLDNESLVDELIADGKADELTGYLAAVRDLKLKKYDNISQLCTDEIASPECEETKNKAYFLRGTMNLIWGKTEETVSDFGKVVKSVVSSDKLKSAAHLKLAMRHSVRDVVDINTLAEEFAKAEEFYAQNPDVYFQGAMTMIDRGFPNEAIGMLEAGLKICGSGTPILMQTLYYTLQFSITDDERQRNEACLRLIEIEKEFDSPECFELYAQSFAMCGEAKSDQIVELMDKAIAYNPSDPVFKIKKAIITRWGGAKMSDSLEDLYKLLETDGDCAVVYYHIGHMEFLRGELEKGFIALEKSIELSTCIHEIQARVASKLEMKFHITVNEKLKENGLSSLSEQVASLALKSFT